MNEVIPIERGMGLAERFWSLARGMAWAGDDRSPVGAVRHVLAVLDALERGESGGDLSVHTLSFLALLRESEQRGDLCYASPEQIRGESLDERSLVFSVGVLLFERLTGRHPFGHDQSRRPARIQRGEMGSGVNYFPNVPAGLRTLLMRAMGPFPEERFATLAELRARLEQFVQDHHASTGPRLPGTSVKRAAKQADATRVVRQATEFGRDLMAANQTPDNAMAARRRERMSELHLRTVSVRMQTGADEPARDSNAEPERPAMSSLPRAGASGRDVAVAASVAATASAQPSPAVSETASAQPSPAVPAYMDTDTATATGHRPGSQMLGRLVWAGVGALAAAALMWFIMRPETPAAPAASQAAAAPAASQAAAAPPAEGVAALTSAKVAATQGAASQGAATAPGTTEPERPTANSAAAFSTERMGEHVVASITPCFADKRVAAGVRFRMGVRISAADGAVGRVYFSPAEELSATERGCLRDSLVGVTAPTAAPESTQVVDYQIRLNKSGGHALVK